MSDTCTDEFDGNVCELHVGHGGNHRRTTDVGLYEWSDPITGDGTGRALPEWNDDDEHEWVPDDE